MEILYGSYLDPIQTIDYMYGYNLKPEISTAVGANLLQTSRSQQHELSAITG